LNCPPPVAPWVIVIVNSLTAVWDSSSVAVISNVYVVSASVVTFTSSTSIAATFNLASGDYYVRIENNDGNAVRSTSAILQSSDAPTWTTAAGSLGSSAGGAALSFTVVATSDSDVTYAKQSGTFPGSVTIASATGIISGTESGSTEETVYTFTIRATDEESQTADREFSITITHGATGGGQFN